MVRIGISALRAWSRNRKMMIADHHHLLDERAAKRVDRGADQAGAVVGGTIRTPLGQVRCDLGDPLLHRVDHVERVLAVAHDDDAADDLAAAVELGEAAAQLGPHR
jgi:hypothetical protein